MREDFGNRFNDRWEQGRKRWEERMERHDRGHHHIWTGIFILLIGVAALIKTTVIGLPHWLFGWQMFLIALGFFVGVKHGFKGMSWLMLMLIGGAFLCIEISPELSIRRYIWPVALIIAGAFLILKPRRRSSWSTWNEGQKKTADNSGISGTTPSEEGQESKEDFIDSTSIFGGAKKNIISKNFRGGDIVNIFGGTELDLSRADFKGTAVIELTTIFGGTKLVVPSDWTIRSEAVTIFGGLDDKRNSQTITDNPEKVLLLQGTVIFGGIDIRSF